MKLFRHLCLIIAVFWCAVMVIAPMAAAEGTGQSTNQGTDLPPGPQGMDPGQANQGNNQGNNQMQQGPGQATGSGNSMNQPGNIQNNAGPGQGNQKQGQGLWNATEFGNMTPPEKPDWNPDNSTVLNSTAWHGHRPVTMTGMNMTGINMTDIPPPGNFDPANMTAMNHTAWHEDGNMTPPAPPAQGNAPGQGRQQTQDQLNSTSDLIAQFLEWLKARSVT